MKSVILLSALVLVAVSARPQSHYTTKYDNFDVDQVIRNDRIMLRYVKCLLGEIRCAAEGMELKRILPDALATGCRKCNERQRNASNKIIRHLINNKRQWWNSLEAKYDPTGNYRKQYANELGSVRQ